MGYFDGREQQEEAGWQGAMDDGQGPYKGFLITECEECGNIRAFCTKRYIYAAKCRECGHETPLEGLRPMYARCKCGEIYRYKTNMHGENFTMNCLSCHTPIDVRLNRRGTAYVTVGERRK